nr:DUF2806 domain-containing protein [Allomuricauda sp.]
MSDPASLGKALEGATKIANTTWFTSIIDRVFGFKISEWAAEGEVRKRIILDEYEKAKSQGLQGMQYIENMRKAENLINTAVKTSEHIDPDQPNEVKMDNDFFWNTVEHAKSVSSDEVQELIAKILASEYNSPGTYSMSTLQIIKMLGRRELELFENVGSLILNSELIPNIVFQGSVDMGKILAPLDIDFNSLQELQHLGLFLPNSMRRNVQNPDKKVLGFEYFDKVLSYECVHKTDFMLTIPGFYGLSKTGKELLQHLNVTKNDDYYEWLKANFKIDNYKCVAE